MNKDRANRSTLLFAGFLALPVVLQAAGVAAPARPNIVFIMADDLGWRDLGCFGSRFHQTPNLDRLATRGVRFTQAYAANPLCSPTRSSVLTGLWPARTGITAPACHVPQVVLEKQLAKGNPNMPVLAAMDECGLTDRTIIVFCSDNGGISWGGKGDAKEHKSARFQADMTAPPTSNLPLRNGKASLYEGGVREPCIVVWPGVTKPGTTNDTVIQSIDWMPTLLDMAGAAKKSAAEAAGSGNTATTPGGA